VVATVERVLIGASREARAHLRVDAEADPLVIDLGRAVDAEDLHERRQPLVMHRPVLASVAGHVGGVMRDRDRVDSLQGGVQLGQGVDASDAVAFAAEYHVVIARGAIALPLVAREGDILPRLVQRAGGVFDFGPLARQLLGRLPALDVD